MSNKQLYIAQKRYTDRKVQNGSLRVTVWCPEHHSEELKRIAKKMREGAWLIPSTL